jgi:hypothetical protein
MGIHWSNGRKTGCIGKEVRAHDARLDSYKSEVNASVESQVRLGQEDFYQRLDSFKAAFISASRGLEGRLDYVELKLIGVLENSSNGFQPSSSQRISTSYPGLNSESGTATRNQHRATTIDVDNNAEEELRHVETRVDNLERKLNSLISKSDERAIRFAGLGFQSIANSNAWLTAELPQHRSGLIVEAHTVLEHVYHAIDGIDTIAMMEKLYKIKVTTIADSVAMTSFDAKTPKYFSKSQAHKSSNLMRLTLIPSCLTQNGPT